MAQARELSLYSETDLEVSASVGFPVSCPTLDLTATWSAASRDLLIYRPPDQVVSKIHPVTAPGQKAPEVRAVTWKPDGQFLAVGWSDGVVRLMGLENNKTAHNIPVCQASSKASIVFIGWSTCFTAGTSKTGVQGLQGEPSPLSAHASADEEGDGWSSKSLLNLPQELTFLEVETALPRISPLPAASSAGTSEDATVFTIRSGVEFLFQSPKRDAYDQVNLMVVGTSDGRLQLSIYDSFVIGSFACPAPPASSSFLVHHASHPRVSTHALVFADRREGPEHLHLVPMDLPFITSSPINLSLLSSKVTTLQTLLRYLKQTSAHMAVEWRNAKELPARFIKAVQADLEAMDSGPRGIVPALYHAVLTGHAYPPLREWLVESLAERGHKRWDKAVVSGLQGLRNLVHQNLLPALERCSFILSRLRGLARFHQDSRGDIGFSLSHIDRVLSIITCLSLVGHKLLVHVMDELQHFTAFSTWLRFQIDRLASSSSSAIDELTEKEATMDNVKVLTYIERYLTNSPLEIFFPASDDEDANKVDWKVLDAAPSLLDLVDEQVSKAEAGQGGIKALAHVDFLVDFAAEWSGNIFNSIAEAKKRSVCFGRPMKLSINQPISTMDVKVSFKDDTGIIFTAVSSSSTPSKVHIFRNPLNHTPSQAIILLKASTAVDIKFLNDTLILLCTDSHGPLILPVPLDHPSLIYAAKPPLSSLNINEYRLPGGKALAPTQMEIRDRTDAGGEKRARIVLLGGGRRKLCSFTFP